MDTVPAPRPDDELPPVRAAFLAAARSAATLLAEPAVAVAWHRPSALAKFPVFELAGHLLNQVLTPREVLAGPVPEDTPLSVLEHYDRTATATVDIDDPDNVGVRAGGAERAAGGHQDVAGQAAAELGPVREQLAAEPADRVVYLPWRSWSLTLDDFLLTRTIEIAVHNDDLAVSVGVPTPTLPASTQDLVLQTLVRVATRRHGATALLRALSRSERAPDTISVF
ncbi:maleylpyruvate isomerase N-terminal domain-containing protein [Micromonospora sp. CPCC 205371]|nr:maleylpyruvate isomerase N-terminal domain-containing protein [Micromonospora sp. CPCC 205371]